MVSRRGEEVAGTSLTSQEPSLGVIFLAAPLRSTPSFEKRSLLWGLWLRDFVFVLRVWPDFHHEEERNMADSTPVFAGSIPANYDRYLVPMYFEPYARDIANRIDIPNEGRVLELACGTGAVTKQLRASLANTVHIVSTDLIPECLKSHRRH